MRDRRDDIGNFWPQKVMFWRRACPSGGCGAGKNLVRAKRQLCPTKRWQGGAAAPPKTVRARVFAASPVSQRWQGFAIKTLKEQAFAFSFRQAGRQRGQHHAP